MYSTGIGRVRRQFSSSTGFDVGYVLCLFVLTRLVLYLVALGAHQVGRRDTGWSETPRGDLHRGQAPSVLEQPLVRWDALFYVTLAREGYPPPRPDGGPVFHAAFFPAYPLAVRALDQVWGDTFAASLAVSNLSTLIALLMIVYSGAFGPRRQRRAVATLAMVFPGSHFLSLPYTEGPFLLLLVLAVHFIDRRDWLAAGLVGAIATATRSTGIAIPMMILAAGVGAPGVAIRLRGLLSAAVASTGLIAYSAFCHFQYGDWKYYSALQPWWGREFSLLGPVRAFLAFNHDPDYYLVSLATIGAVVAGWRGLSVPLKVMALVLLFLPLSTGSLKSMIRFQAINLPAFVGAGARLSGPWFVRLAWLSSGLLAYEMARYSAGFGNN